MKLIPPAPKPTRVAYQTKSTEILIQEPLKPTPANDETKPAPGKELTFWHAGDLGDVIYSLPVIERKGGGHLVMAPLPPSSRYRSQPREGMNQGKMELMRELLEMQPYIRSVRYSDHEPEWNVDLNRFRIPGQIPNTVEHKRAHSLYEQQLLAAGLSRGDERKPWLTLDTFETTPWPIVIHRSGRYHNPKFPWQALVSKFRQKILFIGLPAEHEAFVKEFGPVRYMKVRNLLDTARLIAGSKLFIGNQSCPYAIAEGLKHNTIQETDKLHMDCLFERDNARFIDEDKPMDVVFIHQCLREQASEKVNGETRPVTQLKTLEPEVLPVCIFRGKNDMEQVGRMVEYCAKMDGTDLRVFSDPERESQLKQPEVGNFAFRHVADKMRGQPFIWMEADCIPLKAGWAKRLTELYRTLKVKEFIWSSDQNPPGDLIGGLGVYGPNVGWIIPPDLRPPNMAWGDHWDGWVLQHVPHLLHRTPLIQHSYGIYNPAGRFVGLHEFPRDSYILREDSLLFHKDKEQSLMDPRNRNGH